MEKVISIHFHNFSGSEFQDGHYINNFTKSASQFPHFYDALQLYIVLVMGSIVLTGTCKHNVHFHVDTANPSVADCV